MVFGRSQINNEKDTFGFIKFGPGGRMFLMSFAVCKPLEPLDKPINTDVVPSN